MIVNIARNNAPSYAGEDARQCVSLRSDAAVAEFASLTGGAPRASNSYRLVRARRTLGYNPHTLSTRVWAREAQSSGSVKHSDARQLCEMSVRNGNVT
jgi:hypothetical protein